MHFHRNSRFSCSSTFSFSAMSVGTPGRGPPSISAFLTQSCSVCGVQPTLAAIEVTAAQREGCSSAWSRTIRAARARTSRVNLFVVLLVMAPSSQELEPPANSGRFRNDPSRILRVVSLARRQLRSLFENGWHGRSHKKLSDLRPDRVSR